MGTKENKKPAWAKAKPTKAENDSKPQPWWFNQPNPIDRFTGWLVVWTCCLSIATFGLIAVAILQWRELHKTDETLRDTLRTTQRAWIAPHGVRIDPLPWDNGLARPVVLYRNVGREPAINVRQKIELFGHPDAKLQWPPYNMSLECDRAKKDSGPILTAYPSEAINYEAGIEVVRKGAGKETFREMFSKVNVVFIYGCFVYETFGAEHHSQFCFYMRPIADKPEAEWQWRFCIKGNEAD